MKKEDRFVFLDLNNPEHLGIRKNKKFIPTEFTKIMGITGRKDSYWTKKVEGDKYRQESKENDSPYIGGNVVDIELQEELEKKYNEGILDTIGKYDSLPVLMYNSKAYIRAIWKREDELYLSDGRKPHKGDILWFEAILKEEIKEITVRKALNNALTSGTNISDIETAKKEGSEQDRGDQIHEEQ